MGYPVITRLGINQFWYKHWYSDVNFRSNYKQQKLFITLLEMYINYGLTFNNNINFNEYFFNSRQKFLRSQSFYTNMKYFRRFFFSNYTLGIEHSYFLRYKTGEYFPMRIWFIKYARWIILCFTCFKPIKKKPRNKNLIKKEIYALSPNLLYTNSKAQWIRFKLFFLFFKKNYYKKNYYSF